MYVLSIDACKLTGKSMQNDRWVDLAHTLLLRLPLLLFIFASPDDCRHRHGRDVPGDVALECRLDLSPISRRYSVAHCSE